MKRRAMVGDAGPEDVRKFRRLIAEARAQAASPLTFAGALGKAAQSASKAMLPRSQRDRASPLYQLVRLGQRWPGMQPGQKAAEAADLLQLADASAAIVGEAGETNPPGHDAADPPARRVRADIDG